MRKYAKKSVSRLASCPVANLIGMRLIKGSRGRAVCDMTAASKHLNPLGMVHGGILSYLADATMGFAFVSQLPTEQAGVATNLHISFMRSAMPGDRLRATAKTLSHGRTIYFMECVIRNGAGKIVAKATSTCKVLSEKT